MSIENLAQTVNETRTPDNTRNPEVIRDIDSRIIPDDSNFHDHLQDNLPIDTPSFNPVDYYDPDIRINIPENERENTVVHNPEDLPHDIILDGESSNEINENIDVSGPDDTGAERTDIIDDKDNSYDESESSVDEIVDEKNSERDNNDGRVTEEEKNTNDLDESTVNSESDITDVNNEAQEIKDEYAKELIEASEVPETIDEESIKNMEVRDVPPDEVAKKREEFADNKKDLKREWEKENNQEWPKYKEDVYTESGKLLRKKGSDYDAHHIQPLSKGGENTAKNITPLHVNNHYDSKGVHSPNGACSKLK